MSDRIENDWIDWPSAEEQPVCRRRLRADSLKSIFAGHWTGRVRYAVRRNIVPTSIVHIGECRARLEHRKYSVTSRTGCRYHRGDKRHWL